MCDFRKRAVSTAFSRPSLTATMVSDGIDCCSFANAELTDAGAAPCSPQVEKNVMAVEAREREPFAFRIEKRGCRHAPRPGRRE